jgi:general stress protein YciG
VPTKEEISEYFAKFGRKGGKATAKNRTPEQRQAAARKAVKARWAKEKKKL